MVVAWPLLCLAQAVGAATFTVTNTNDSGPGSLRQAMTDANADAAQDTISFNIPGTSVQVINVGSTPLPWLTSPVLLDGYTQPGSRPNTLTVGNNAIILIHLKGRGVASGETGLILKGGNTRIRGLAITGFRTAVWSADPLGGNVIGGNFIGLDPSGQTAAPNSSGISTSAPLTTIGGEAPDERNVISGNDKGISISGSGSTLVAGNYIGTTASGTAAIPNRTGVQVIGGGPSNRSLIGGSDRASANVISGNQFGVHLGDWIYSPHTGYMESRPARYATIAGNLIGTTADGQGALGNNVGVYVENSAHNMIGGTEAASGNTIAFNRFYGVWLNNFLRDNPTIGNSVLSNRIYRNESRGIRLAPEFSDTGNDPKDPDTGPNNLQNYPLLTTSSIVNGTVTSNGILNSTPNSGFTIQFFADSRSLTTPGQTYLGSTAVTTDANGDAQFSVRFPIADGNVFINATATNAANGDTSEFYYNPPKLVNISTRLRVGTGENVLIAGFVFRGSSVILRGLGPSLNVNGTPVPGALQDPVIYVYDDKGQLKGISDDWKNDTRPQELGPLAPVDDREAAFVRYLSGANTVVLRGKDDGTGVALVEAYAQGEFLNISTRGLVGTGDDVMIGGFIAADSNGPARYVIRAMGPSLAAAGISNPLADPTLELYDSNGALIDRNDDWKDGEQSTIREAGLAPQSDAEAVIVTTQEIGAYTAIVRGKNGTTGVGLVEVYNLR